VKPIEVALDPPLHRIPLRCDPDDSPGDKVGRGQALQCRPDPIGTGLAVGVGRQENTVGRARRMMQAEGDGGPACTTGIGIRGRVSLSHRERKGHATSMLAYHLLARIRAIIEEEEHGSLDVAQVQSPDRLQQLR
jgi:hypothetical protein